MKTNHAEAKACQTGKRATSIAHRKTTRTFPAPIAESRIAFGRALRTLRRREPATARKLRGVERAAWKVALAKAGFLRDGTAHFTGADGARISKAQAGKRLVVKVATRDGTGRAVEWQTLGEMHAAARAELIAARLAGKDGMTEANREANAELHYAARERIFSDAHKAESGNARAWQNGRDTDLHGCAEPGRPQPHAAEFLAESGEENLSPQGIVKNATARAVAALRAFYRRKKYPRARKDHARDLRSLRAHARLIASGEVMRAKWRDDKAASERARDLGERVKEGMELLATAPTPAPAHGYGRAPSRETMSMEAARDGMIAECGERREVVTGIIPGTGLGYPERRTARIMHSAQIVRLRITPLAERLLSRATADDLASLAGWHPGLQ